MSWIYLPEFKALFSLSHQFGMLLGVKLPLLAATDAWAGNSAAAQPWQKPAWW